jgi:hypothetical protein
MRAHQILSRASLVESQAFALTRKRHLGFLCVLRQAGDQGGRRAKVTRRSQLSSRATLHPPPQSRARIIPNVLPGFPFTSLHPNHLRCTKKGGGALIDATVTFHAAPTCVTACRRSGRGRATGAHAYRRSAAALVAANERHRSASARTSWDLASSGVTRIWPVHSVQRVAPQYRS